jgi:hypothetical protein
LKLRGDSSTKRSSQRLRGPVGPMPLSYKSGDSKRRFAPALRAGGENLGHSMHSDLRGRMPAPQNQAGALSRASSAVPARPPRPARSSRSRGALIAEGAGLAGRCLGGREGEGRRGRSFAVRSSHLWTPAPGRQGQPPGTMRPQGCWEREAQASA